MTGVVNQSSGQLASLARSFLDPVLPELDAVEQRLRRELRSRHAFVDELVRYGCLLGGKRLRPSLLLLAGRAVGPLLPEHITLATVVEMIHTATLVHDDVLDGAATRRHLATVNARWDTESSILLGDFLFTHAFYLASTLDSTAACRRIGRATNIVCEGELRQKGTIGDLYLREQEYLGIIEAKTAELCACSCALGACSAGADSDLVERFDRYGRYLGISFQITDDVLDVVGSEGETGKSLGTDLEKRKPTLPLIRLMSLVRAAERLEIAQLLDGQTAGLHDELLGYFRRYDTLDYARQQAERYAERARRELDALPDSPALQSLLQIADFAVHRVA
jgi:octaprenyl-diphosphate synthase